MESRSSSAASNNGVVCHVLGAVGNASLDKDSLQLPLVGGLLCLLNDSLVCQGGNVVGLSEHGHLELVLDDARHLNRVLEKGEVFVLEADKGDVIRHLTIDGVDLAVGGGAREVGECGIDLGGELHLVDVVQLEGLVNGRWQAGPDDIVGVDRGDEEDGL